MNSESGRSDSRNSDDIKGILGNLISENSPQFTDVLEQMHFLHEVFQAQVYTGNVEFEQLLGRVREVFSSTEYGQHLKQVTTELRSLADHLDQSSAPLGDALDEFIQSFVQKLEDDELKQREQLQKKCSEETQATIARSLSNIKFTSNNYQDLLSGFNKQLEEIQQNLYDQMEKQDIDSQ